MMGKAWQHTKLLYIRHKNKKAFLEKRRKIAPLNLKEVDLEQQNTLNAQPKKNMSVVLQEIQEESSIKEDEESARMKQPRNSNLLMPLDNQVEP